MYYDDDGRVKPNLNGLSFKQFWTIKHSNIDMSWIDWLIQNSRQIFSIVQLKTINMIYPTLFVEQKMVEEWKIKLIQCIKPKTKNQKPKHDMPAIPLRLLYQWTIWFIKKKMLEEKTKQVGEKTCLVKTNPPKSTQQIKKKIWNS